MAFEFGTMSRRGQWTVIGLLCAVMAVVFYMYIWSPTQEDITTISAQIAQLTQEIQRTRAVAERLPELEAELARLEQRLETLSFILPESQEVDVLLRRLVVAAADSNLAVSRTAFQNQVPHDFYVEAPFTMQVAGTYHDLARFFDRVGKLARIVNVDEVSIQGLENDPSGSTISAMCTAKTFYFLEEEEIQAAPGEAPTTTGGGR